MNVIELLFSYVIPSLTLIALTGIIVLQVTNMKILGMIPNDLGKIFQETFADPQVKRAMSVLGKESGRVRAEQATVDTFNENLPNIFPALGMIGERLGLEPTEMISLFNDPMIGPFIQNAFQGILSNQGQGQGQSRRVPTA